MPVGLPARQKQLKSNKRRKNCSIQELWRQERTYIGVDRSRKLPIKSLASPAFNLVKTSYLARPVGEVATEPAPSPPSPSVSFYRTYCRDACAVGKPFCRTLIEPCRIFLFCRMRCRSRTPAVRQALSRTVESCSAPDRSCVKIGVP